MNPNRNKKLPPTKILIAEPITFMNTQGELIKKIMESLNINYSIHRKSRITKSIRNENIM